MLKIKNLHASVEGKEILKGINLEVNAGEILFENEDISELATEERAHKGVFLSFQYPVEIPGGHRNKLYENGYQ